MKDVKRLVCMEIPEPKLGHANISMAACPEPARPSDGAAPPEA